MRQAPSAVLPEIHASAPARADIWPYLLWPSVLLVFVANAVQLLHQPLQVDVAWYLNVGRELLAGKRLSIDILEVSPPLICFLNVIPNWISVAFHLDVKLVWFVLASTALAGPAILSVYLLDRALLVSGWLRALTGFVLAVVLVVPFGGVFGERDHFGFAGSLPLVFLMMNRIRGTSVSLPLAVVSAVWAGMFLALKPFFLIPWALCLLFTFSRLQLRILRLPETYIVPLLTVLHFLLIVFVTPAYFEVARLVARWYDGYNVQRRFILMALSVPAWGVALSILYQATSSYRAVIRLIGLLTFGWILSAIVQHKGNDYHLVPAVASVALLTYFVLLDLWSRDLWEQISIVPVSAAGLLLAFGIGTYAFSEERALKIDYFNGSGVLLPALRSVEHSRVMFLSTSMIGFPAVNETDVEFINAASCLWTMPGLYAAATRSIPQDSDLEFHDFSTMPAAERDLFDRTYRELASKPKLIVVDAHKYKWAMGSALFDFETYFQRDPRIRELWSNYHELSPVKDFRIYKLNEPAVTVGSSPRPLPLPAL